jgi:transposase InsO family protein
VEVFFTLDDVREKLAQWQADYNLLRPHSALRDQAPAIFAGDWMRTGQADLLSPALLETLT